MSVEREQIAAFATHVEHDCVFDSLHRRRYDALAAALSVAGI
jgi:hypothetical protein